MGTQFVKVFGERNTGTRAINHMLSNLPTTHVANKALRKTDEIRALELRVKERFRSNWAKKYLRGIMHDNRIRVGGVGGWKHAAPQFDSSFAKANSCVIFAIKNPYSWLISLVNNPYHIQGYGCSSLEQFVDCPWLTKPIDNTLAVLPSPMALWNEKLRAYLKFESESDVPNARVKFEDFVRDPITALGDALQHFGVDPSGLQLRDDSTKDDDRKYDDIKKFYADEDWMRFLNRQTVAVINGYTDWEIAAAFGYSALDPNDFPIDLTKEKSAYLAKQFERLHFDHSIESD